MEIDLTDRPFRQLVDHNIGSTLRKVDDGDALTPEEATEVVAWLSSVTDTTDQALRDMHDVLGKLYFTRLVAFMSLASTCWLLAPHVVEYWRP